jgi:hypothetical protein
MQRMALRKLIRVPQMPSAFIRLYDETLSVAAIGIGNPDCSPLGNPRLRAQPKLNRLS